MPLIDGEGHPLAIKELEDIGERPDDNYPVAAGALIKQRSEAILRGVLDDYFERHELPEGGSLYSVNHCRGWVGITSVFLLKDNKLTLLSVVAFDSVKEEAMSAGALTKAIALAIERMKDNEGD